MSPAGDLVHDEEKTRTPSHPTMAGAFDRLVESNLELVASVTRLVASNVELVALVQQLIKAMTDGKAP